MQRELHARRAAPARSGPLCAVVVTGGVGDFLVIARFLRDLGAALGGFSFDAFCPVPARAEWTFAHVPGFTRAHHDIMFRRLRLDYELALQINQTVTVHGADPWRNLRSPIDVAEQIIRATDRIGPLVDQHPYLDNAIARIAVAAGRTRRDYLHHLAGIPYGGDKIAVPSDFATPARLHLPAGKYITVHNGFDAGFVISGRRATKCYPHFDAVLRILKPALPDLAFVQLGAAGTSARLRHCDLDLVGCTSWRETAGLLAQAAFHIDGDSGLVHLARCHGVRSGVVFGPTPG
ncbi:MAG TPA: glycosyltransferase family 9 protein, partial [Acetobacteraceae bacterium]|nr:glycosyltransferase family 9 protein [Acetobacteraceae bacterium]